MYLITGGTGFLGQVLLQRLRSLNVPTVRVIARNEGRLIALQDQFPFIQIIPGDIGDPYTCRRACNNVTGIFHLAAFKHVSLAEQNTRQCVWSNVLGTVNILEEAQRIAPAFVIGASTDKAAQVQGVYGATKLIQERLFLEYEQLNPKTKYRTVRFGNLLYSTGSVLCKWKERLLKGDEIVVTDMDATRFYWSAEQAVNLIFECLEHAENATPYVPTMKAASLGLLVKAMIQRYGQPGAADRIRVVGLQPGESLHEVIIEGGPNSSEVTQYTLDELLELV